MTESQEASDPGPAAGASVVPVAHREHRFPGRRRGVFVRFDEGEYAAISTAAGRVGLTASGYVAACAVAAAAGVVPPVPSQTREALTELMAARVQVRRFGTNVNQAVAQLNGTGVAPEWLEAAVAGTVRAVARLDAAAELLMRRRG